MSLDMFSVCGTNGICEADPEAGYVRCLCDNGWTGDICEEEMDEIIVVDQSHPGLLAAIIICIILLGIAIVLSAVLCHKIRMKEAEESSGTMTIGLTEDNDAANLQQTKQNAMTMGVVGNTNTTTSSSAVRLTMDDQLVNDDNNDGKNKTNDNELIDDDNNTNKNNDNNTLLDDDGAAGQDKDEQL